MGEKVEAVGGSVCTHIDNIILGIVCVGAANVEPVALLHRLYDAHMILAIKHLKRERKREY